MNDLLYTYKKLLSEFVSFKSIALDKKYSPEIQKSVEWLVNLFKAQDFKVECLTGKNSNPILFAQYSNGSKETILIYGHYDVQPEGDLSEWKTNPYKLSERDNFLYARGVLDNKGQILIHILSVFELIKNKTLGYNVKFLIEGNEETGNEDMQVILKNNNELLKSDYVMVSDGEVYRNNPLIEASLRGGFGMKVVIKNGNSNLHSGLYGGAIYNAGTIAANLISKIINENNNVLIPGFENDVDEITKEEIDNTNKLIAPKVGGLIPDSIENFYAKTGLKPTIQVTGFSTGYNGEGFNNIIPGTAEFKLNIRTVASQDYKKVEDQLLSFIKNNTPKGIQLEITTGGQHNPVKLDINSAMHNKAKVILKEAFGNKPFIKYVGGAVPFVTDVKEIYGIDTLLIPLGSDNSNAHGPNENYDIDIIEKGFKFSIKFFSKILTNPENND